MLEASTKHPRRLIGEEEVEVRPEVLPDATIDESVDVHQIIKYFTTVAWTLLQEAVTKRETIMFISAIHVFMTWMSHHLFYVIIVYFGTI